MKFEQISTFIEKHYHILGLVSYVGLINLRKEVSYMDAIVVVSLFGFSAYRMFIQSKGKILDKDLLLEEIKAFRSKVKQSETQNEELKKEIQEVKNKVGLLTQKNILGQSGYKY